jgi:hypothetical protein
MRRASTDSRPASVEKTFFDLSKGFVTELSPLGMPGGTTIGESNFEILRDGTRRRRKGILPEIGGEYFELGTYNVAGAIDISEVQQLSRFNEYRWSGVNNNPNLVFVCIKLGGTLHFYSEDETLSTNRWAGVIDLCSFIVGNTTSTNYCSEAGNFDITMSSMHGRLFIAGKYIKPIYISFNEATNEFTSNLVDIRVRDLVGVEDGVTVGQHTPTLTENQTYNLVNRGWNATTLLRYFDGRLADGTTKTSGLYPSKNQIWWKAMVRYAGSGYAQNLSDLTKLRSFDTAALEQEVFGTTSAPQGHLFLNPFDTTIATTYGVEDNTITSFPITNITNTTHQEYADAIELPLTLYFTGATGWNAGDDIVLNGTSIKLNLKSGGTVITDLSNQSFEIQTRTTVSGNDQVVILYRWSGARLKLPGHATPGHPFNSYVTLGFATEGGVYNRESAYVTELRPTAVTTFAGRVWYGGCEHPALADIIWFSQIGDSTDDGVRQYGKMYQEGDPSSEYLNLVLPNDGGTIQIPGLSGIKALVPTNSSIIVLATNGIWEISGGDTFFSALAIQVRKIADIEVVSTNAWAFTDHGMMVVSPRGLFVIEDNEQSGRLGVRNLTLDSIQTYWQTIVSENFKTLQLAYDNALYRLYVFFNRLDTSGYSKYTEALVFDLQHNSFYKLEFPQTNTFYIHGVNTINDVNSVNDNKKLKFYVIETGTGGQFLKICDMAQTAFDDFDGTESIPYIETGYDGIGEANYRAQEAAQAAPDHARHRSSPYIHVFMRRTETGVDGDTGEVLNPSSLLMEAHWDFASDPLTGKVGTSQQVYRPRSNALTELPAYPVVISKNKARGRGRALHLKFTGELSKDAHLLGYSVEYKGERKA